MLPVSSIDAPSQQVLAEIVNRIVRVANPDRIIMFGSAAMGTMSPDSDIDLLVISQHDENRRQILGDIYIALHGVGQAVDVIMVTPEEVVRYRESAGLIIQPAMASGKEIYRADASRTR
jgi:uncharacterized protein